MTTPPLRQQEFKDSVIHQNRRRIGLMADLYTSLLRMKWRSLLLWFAALYFAINACFATLYLWVGQGIQGARDHSWWDAFHFSIQTIATIGYGGMLPRGLASNTLVAIESWMGILVVALCTGIVFAKFARPSARILFSRVAVVHQHEGIPSLIFRLANQRNSHIIEAHVNVTVLLEETSQEGERMRRLHDLTLVRSFHPVLSMSWTVIHPIDPHSPLFSFLTHLQPNRFLRIFVTMSGVDAIFQKTTHAHYFYDAEHLVWNARLVDIFPHSPDLSSPSHLQLGSAFDVHKFHDYVHVPEESPMHCPSFSQSNR